MNKRERESGIECLRIVAMVMIIASHLSFHGLLQRVLDNQNELYHLGSAINKLFASMLLPGGEVGVDLFFIISGYFLSTRKKVNYKGLIRIILHACICAVIAITILAVCIELGWWNINVSRLMLIQWCMSAIINPVFGGAWWFLSAYIIMILMSPAINDILCKLTKRGKTISFLILVLSALVMGKLVGSDYIFISRAVVFYTVGHYLKSTKHEKSILFDIFIAILMWVSSGLLSYFSNEIIFNSAAIDMIIKRMVSVVNVSALNPICAIYIFYAFSKIHTANRFVKLVSPTTFGVYLLHDSYVGRLMIWNMIVNMNAIYRMKAFPAIAMAVVILVFAVCSGIDFIFVKPIENIIFNRLEHLKNKLIDEEGI